MRLIDVFMVLPEVGISWCSRESTTGKDDETRSILTVFKIVVPLYQYGDGIIGYTIEIYGV